MHSRPKHHHRQDLPGLVVLAPPGHRARRHQGRLQGVSGGIAVGQVLPHEDEDAQVRRVPLPIRHCIHGVRTR